jgi:CRP-like cAMP-binding protein
MIPASTSDVTARLGLIDLFQGLSPKVLGKVAAAGKVTDFAPGAETVATLTEGAYFGEMSLVDGQPRSAAVVAGAFGLATFAIPKWSFDALLTRHPEIAVSMLRVLCGRLRRAEAASD